MEVTPAQRKIFWALTLATAVTRWIALSATMWDWDEGLFMLALRGYDVRQHHPHPPGFPLYVATAKLFQWIGFSDFHALQAVNFSAAVLVLPVMYALMRELRAPFETAIVTALMLAYFPNVWFFGGTAFSDVPSMLLSIAAIWLLLRGARSDGALLCGAIVSAVAIGFRPQNAAIVGIPFLIAIVRRHALRSGAARDRLRDSSQSTRLAMTFVALALGAIIVVAAYGTAARLSGGWSVYRNVIAVHQRYIVNTDSFVAPTRPRLLGVVDDFFIRPYRAPVINTAVTILALVSVVAAFVRPRMAVWMAVACFAPLALLSFLMLDWLSASRFSIAYAPMMAILAVDGARVAARRFQVALGGAVVVLMIAWALPAMWEAHTEPSPPARAAAWLREHYKPADCTVYVDKRVVPQSQVLLADYDRKQLDLDAAPATIVDDPKGIVFSELAISAPDAHTFVRKRPRLWDIARRRYFESCVVPSRELFTARVSGNRATVTLPPIPGDGKLLVAVRDNLAARLTFNGHDLGTMHGEATFRVLSRDRAPNELVIVAQSPVAIDRIGWVRRD